MRLSKKCQYALRAVFELALRAPGEPVKIHQIAGAQNIPPRFLEVILNQLRQAGFVDSRRGNEGGYMLARLAEGLTVGEIIACIQGPITIAAGHGINAGIGQYYCGDYAFNQLWKSVNSAISAVCDNTTFAELIEYEKTKRMIPVPDYSI